MPDTGTASTATQRQARLPWTFATAELQLKLDFCSAGHMSLLSAHVDRSHPLHALWEETRNLLDQSFLPPNTTAGRNIDVIKMKGLCEHILRRCFATKTTYRAGGDWQHELPRRAELLVMRYAFHEHQSTKFLAPMVNALAVCGSLQLFQILHRGEERSMVAEAWDAAELLARQRAATLHAVYAANLEKEGEIIAMERRVRERHTHVAGMLDELMAAEDSLHAFRRRIQQERQELRAAEAASREGLVLLRECSQRLMEMRDEWQGAIQDEQSSQKEDMSPTGPSEACEE